MIAVSALIIVVIQTTILRFSIKTYDIPKSMIKPMPPTIANFIKEEFRKTYFNV